MNKELYTTGFYNDPNLVSYWRFEGNSNDSKGANNGTDTSITYGTGYGKFGQGVNFNGSTGRINLATTDSLKLTGPYTLTTWIKTSLNATAVIFQNNYDGNAGTYGFNCEITSSGYLRMWQGTSTYQGDVVGNINVVQNKWIFICFVWDGIFRKIFVNGILDNSNIGVNCSYTSTLYTNIGSIWFRNTSTYAFYFNGSMDDIALFDRGLSDSEVYNLYNANKTYYHQGQTSDYGSLPCGDNNSISLDTWPRFQKLLQRSVEAGKLSIRDIVSTYSLGYTTAYAYQGGVLTPNGDIYFIPRKADRGMKLSASNIISTFTLIHTIEDSYAGGVLAPNGDVHFISNCARVGQKISSSGVVSTYSLVYTTNWAYFGGVLSPNGDINFIPCNATVGQKISSSGVVSTYSLIYTTTDAYYGGILAPNGDIHFVPTKATVGQKISASGVVSTYSLVYTTPVAYICGALSSNGDIHFIPNYASVGQKIDTNGTVSTYSLIYTTTDAYVGGVLAPNGDIHFIPFCAEVGQKISNDGIVSTYSLVHTNVPAYLGGVLTLNGDIHFIPGTTVGQKISTQSTLPFSLGLCCSPFFNKF